MTSSRIKAGPLHVVLVRESNPRGGVRSHIETLTRALASEVSFRDLYPPPSTTFTRATIWMRSGF